MPISAGSMHRPTAVWGSADVDEDSGDVGGEEIAREKARVLIESYRSVTRERDVLAREVAALNERLAVAAVTSQRETDAAIRPLVRSVQALDSEVQVLREGRMADKQKLREMSELLADSGAGYVAPTLDRSEQFTQVDFPHTAVAGPPLTIEHSQGPAGSAAARAHEGANTVTVQRGPIPLYSELEEAYRRLQKAEIEAGRVAQLEQENAGLRAQLAEARGGVGVEQLPAVTPQPVRYYNLAVLPGKDADRVRMDSDLCADVSATDTVWDLLPQSSCTVLLITSEDVSDLVNTSCRGLARVKLSCEVGRLELHEDARGVETETGSGAVSYVVSIPPRTRRRLVRGVLVGATAVVSFETPVQDLAFRAAQRDTLCRALIDDSKKPMCEGGLYIDPDFSPSSDEKFGWSRPLPHESLFGRGEAEDDVRQGELADNCFVGCLRALLQWRCRPEEWFEQAEWLQQQSLQSGQIVLKLYDRRLPQRVVVDTLLPRLGAAPAYVRSGAKGMLWASYLEKACAKMLGGYEWLCRGSTQTPLGCLTMLTPLRVHEFHLQGVCTGVLHEMVSWVLQRQLVVLVPRVCDASVEGIPQLCHSDLYVVTGCSARLGGDVQLQAATHTADEEMVVVPRIVVPRLFSGGCTVFTRDSTA
eukprot:TRINITY_DN27005_c0_g1_i1.p1 TRINITY_DN27005_c0_g1~~TRINITY_DN27005_c0_g1_i1.p1  ORF type:complete len:645 (+),score=120.78 TRINITY_DN27005_c0_g1_i1:52-1986(+)